MIWPGCAPETDPGSLRPRRSGDGSFSLFSEAVGEGFHSADGALAEARATFVAPAGLERFAAGSRLTVVEVAVGTGTNTAALIEALTARRLELSWWGLETDPEPLRLALADAGFRRQWAPPTLERLGELTAGERLLWGDARQRLPALLPQASGLCDLVLLDAFSPRRCPELWTREFLLALARLLAPGGRLLTYCSAAAVRTSLFGAGLQLAAIRPGGKGHWSGGTAASPGEAPAGPALRPLSAMELEHLATRAGEPYRDPDGRRPSGEILSARERAQAESTAESSGTWQRRWGVRRRRTGVCPPGRAPGEPLQDR
jgi:tRNA U34 5-methylaminomethyl-2-thiouridine-forming methyltransferase MnmC